MAGATKFEPCTTSDSVFDTSFFPHYSINNNMLDVGMISVKCKLNAIDAVGLRQRAAFAYS